MEQSLSSCICQYCDFKPRTPKYFAPASLLLKAFTVDVCQIFCYPVLFKSLWSRQIHRTPRTVFTHLGVIIFANHFFHLAFVCKSFFQYCQHQPRNMNGLASCFIYLHFQLFKTFPQVTCKTLTFVFRHCKTNQSAHTFYSQSLSTIFMKLVLVEKNHFENMFSLYTYEQWRTVHMRHRGTAP